MEYTYSQIARRPVELNEVYALKMDTDYGPIINNFRITPREIYDRWLLNKRTKIIVCRVTEVHQFKGESLEKEHLDS